jgi:hypothetical protein
LTSYRALRLLQGTKPRQDARPTALVAPRGDLRLPVHREALGKGKACARGDGVALGGPAVHARPFGHNHERFAAVLRGRNGCTMAGHIILRSTGSAAKCVGPGCVVGDGAARKVGAWAGWSGDPDSTLPPATPRITHGVQSRDMTPVTERTGCGKAARPDL